MDNNEEKSYLRFTQSYNKVILSKQKKDGIGTLSEKSLHAIIKNYLEPDEFKQEIKIGSYYADIFNEEIIEIQTKQFNKLRKKLDCFLKEYKVTVVYPIAYKKWLYWVDKDTAEISKGRKSPKTGVCYQAFIELYKIKSFLKNPNLKIKIILLDIEEYRYLNGWSKDKKNGSHCKDRIPTRIEKEIDIYNLEDYKKLIPKDLEENFTSKEFSKQAKIPVRLGQVVLNILYETEAVKRVGKKGNSYIYERN